MKPKLIATFYFVLIVSLKTFQINCEFTQKTPSYSIFDLINPDKFIEKYDHHFLNKYNDSPPPNHEPPQQTTATTTTESTLSTETESTPTDTNPPLFTHHTGPPVQLTNTPETITISKGPQSLTIFMNFQNDGTTSIQALNENNLNWFDLGNCRHGQIFDSITGVCREVFCVEGSIFTAQGCIQTNASNTHTEPIKKPSPDMNIEITIANKLCTYVKNHNDTIDCEYKLSMEPSEVFIQNLKKEFSRFLGIKNERISNFSVVNHTLVNYTIISFEDNKNQTERLLFRNSSYQKYDLSTTELNELLKLRFHLGDRKLFEQDQDDKETILLFYLLVMFSMDKKYLDLIPNRETYFSDVIEIRTSPDQGWCNLKGDRLLSFQKNFHVLASFDQQTNAKYYVYANETDTLYGTGYFQLTFMVPNLKFPDKKATQADLDHSINHNMWIIKSDQTQIISDHYKNANDSKIDYLNITLTLYDVTEVFFPNSNDLMKLLTVCSIAPKIRIQCKNYQTIRIRLCELAKMRDGSYCSYLTKVCYFSLCIFII